MEEQIEASANRFRALIENRDDIYSVHAGERFGVDVIFVSFHPDFPYRPESVPAVFEGWPVHPVACTHDMIERFEEEAEARRRRLEREAQEGASGEQ
jgi:hypothetical protein